MPTKRPRITITESPEVARRLNLVAARMPERAHSRADLLLALTELAENVLVETKYDGRQDNREKAKQFVLRYTADITPEQSEAILDAREADWADDDLS
jgi:hypothetical protein